MRSTSYMDRYAYHNKSCRLGCRYDQSLKMLLHKLTIRLDARSREVLEMRAAWERTLAGAKVTHSDGR